MKQYIENLTQLLDQLIPPYDDCTQYAITQKRGYLEVKFNSVTDSDFNFFQVAKLIRDADSLTQIQRVEVELKKYRVYFARSKSKSTFELIHCSDPVPYSDSSNIKNKIQFCSKFIELATERRVFSSSVRIEPYSSAVTIEFPCEEYIGGVADTIKSTSLECRLPIFKMLTSKTKIQLWLYDVNRADTTLFKTVSTHPIDKTVSNIVDEFCSEFSARKIPWASASRSVYSFCSFHVNEPVQAEMTEAIKSVVVKNYLPVVVS